MLDLLLEYESASDRSADLERICESMTTITSGEQRRLGRAPRRGLGRRARVSGTSDREGKRANNPGSRCYPGSLCLLNLLSRAQSAPAQLMRAMRLA